MPIVPVPGAQTLKTFVGTETIEVAAGSTKAQVPVGAMPAGMGGLFGLGGATFGFEGNINRQLSVAGVAPGATGADNVVMAFTIPANSFDSVGRGLNIIAQGKFAANGNTKQIKIIFNPATAVVGSTVGAGGTTVADTGAVTTNAGGWAIEANVFATGANAQLGLHQQAQVGGAVSALLAASAIAAVTNAPILVAVTINNTSTASDAVAQFLEINAMN